MCVSCAMSITRMHWKNNQNDAKIRIISIIIIISIRSSIDNTNVTNDIFKELIRDSEGV